MLLYADVVGAILIGGHSSRMGRDKPDLRLFGENEPTLLQRTYDVLSNILSSVWLSCRCNKMAEKYYCVPDVYRDIGPLGGVHALLSEAEQEGFKAVLILSCDLPCITEACLQRLLDARCHRMRMNVPEMLVTTCYNEETGYIEPLISIYEVAALPFLSRAIVTGERKLQSIIPREHWQRVAFSADESTAFFNLNTPQDIVHFANMLKK